LGRVISRTSQQGVSNLRVEAWDKDLIVNDLIGSAVTAADGAFRMELASSYFRAKFLDRQPDLFFKVFDGSNLVKSTEDSVLWNVDAGETEVVIEVDVEATHTPTSESRDPFEPFLIPVDAENALRDQLKLTSAKNPQANGTLGDMGLAVEVSGVEEFSLTIL